MRALVVDDSRAMRTILSRIIAGIGFEVTQAGDGKQALAQLLLGAPPELMLVDWNMPEMNGLELVTAVRAQPGYAGIKIVMVTTESELAQIAKAIDAGADEYVMKPFTADIMLDKLRIVGLSEPE